MLDISKKAQLQANVLTDTFTLTVVVDSYFICHERAEVSSSKN